MARKDEQDSGEKKGRIAQIKQTYRMARRVDRWVGWITLAYMLGALAIVALIGFLLGPLWMWLIVGLPTALLAGAVVFGRRAERAAYAQIEGQPGAAAAALGTLRRGWDNTPGVGANRHQDVVHRAVGRPGIVLIGEGDSPGRVSNLLAQEKKRHSRVAPETPVYEFIIGHGENLVPLPQLTKRMRKLPKNLRPAEVTELRHRLNALSFQPVGMPKGPLPKGMKAPSAGAPPAQQDDRAHAGRQKGGRRRS
ncbi:DUF4191 domain-containing protein [Actinobacteria bacterium YIM 96077]|uniref:DUF4191 domain-containing protein n=1 Tax=Phytoactinopolyspora halophila TaxID=1981511 RepID=A0A329QAF8_9ACTN|nr:DUF4191 domain-containing protein [Phytoactinopolyspora halophila]AYY13703.1 DUF4191 domain-containing protein [Actinobacteria bacterium YIM 96077]RAW09365.1 DUF4191 domain-containing protein [Phytoactinopolyspora halophila]